MRLSIFQRTFLKALIQKLMFVPSLFFLMWAVFPLQWDRPLVIYLMLSLYDWLWFILTLIFGISLELLINSPDLRRNLRSLKFERGAKVEKKPEDKKSEKAEKKEKVKTEAEMMPF